MTKRRRIILGAAAALMVCVTIAMGGCMSVIMPGQSYSGPLPPLSESQAALADEMRGDVIMLARTIGERHVGDAWRYHQAADFIERAFADAGYSVERQSYVVDGVTCHNLIAEARGGARPGEIVILGAHYDSVRGTVGANDNASGVAALLAIARRLKGEPPDRTLRFVAFANEEPPYFHTPHMGSMVYATACRQRGDDIVAVIVLDGLGCYHDEPGTQQYPLPVGMIYGTRADFIGFVANTDSSKLVKRVIGTFRTHAQFPSTGIALPGVIEGVGWSDHWSFWQHDYPGVMVTDTLPFRYAHYHTTEDTPDKIDYEKMARVVEGLEAVMRELVSVTSNGPR